MDSLLINTEIHPFFQCIPYEVLVQQLDMKNLRELEDLVIEAIYGGLSSSHLSI